MAMPELRFSLRGVRWQLVHKPGPAPHNMYIVMKFCMGWSRRWPRHSAEMLPEPRRTAAFKASSDSGQITKAEMGEGTKAPFGKKRI